MSPAKNSRRFYAEARKYGFPVEYIENKDNHVYINRDFRRFAFDFFNRTANVYQYKICGKYFKNLFLQTL